MLEQLIHALHEAIGSGSAAGLLIGGVLLGVFVGVIPGLSGAVVLSIALAFVYKLNLQATLVLFLAVAAASFFSASIASILLNSPAHPEAFPVSLDGYPMTEKGEAARALGISASATALGGVIGGLVMVGMLQVIMPLTKFFHPPEYVAIVALAMFLVATQGQISTSKSLVSVGVGFLISSIGTSTVTGTPRFDFGSSYLLGGIPLGVFAIGIFAIPQMILFFGAAKNVMGSKSRGDDGVIEGAGVGGDTFALSRVGTQIFQGVLDVLHNWSVVIGGALVGVMGGIIPGIGGFTANYVSYGLTKQLSKDEEKFGTGIPKGVVAPEASSIAKEAGGLVPTLGLGIPHGTASALFLAALAIQDQQVGIGFVKSHMVISYEMVWIIVLAGIFGAIFGLLLIPILIKVTRTPGILIFPFII
jgi:putative tricarboxylic transport membrane protein